LGVRLALCNAPWKGMSGSVSNISAKGLWMLDTGATDMG